MVWSDGLIGRFGQVTWSDGSVRWLDRGLGRLARLSSLIWSLDFEGSGTGSQSETNRTPSEGLQSQKQTKTAVNPSVNKDL